jgi:hypothetical protein
MTSPILYARYDPRQTSLFGDGHEAELQGIDLYDDTFCGCSDHQLEYEISSTSPHFTVKELRAQHTLRAQRIHNTGPECPHTEMRTIHVI